MVQRTASGRSRRPLLEAPKWDSLVRAPPLGSHVLQVYEERRRQVEVAGLFVAEALRRGERVCCVGSTLDTAVIRKALGDAGFEVDSLLRSRALLIANRLAINGEPRDPEEISPPSVTQFLHDTFEGVPDRYPALRLWVNRIDRFFEDGRFEQAIAFEQACHERRDAFPWSLLCAYDARKLIPERHAAAFWDVLRNHSHLIPAGELGVALELFPDGGGS